MPLANVIPFDLPGFEVDQVDEYDALLVIQAHSTAMEAICPDCDQSSSRVHSYYTREPRDLPSSGRKVRLVLGVRRFRCQNARCRRKTFAERIPHVTPVHGQRTERLTSTLHAIAFELSAEAGARVTHHLNMTVSGDTLLRILRQAPTSPDPLVRVLGVDDWAFKKGHQYGTILVNLEQHRPIELLPDRTAETLANWLKAHPEVEIVTRDRSGEYIAGVTQGAPQAVQVADRWHLLRNLGDALQRMLRRQPRALRSVACATYDHLRSDVTATADDSPDNALPDMDLPEQEPQTYRQMRFDEVKVLAAKGFSHRAIARQLQMHRETVARFLQLDELPERALPPQNTSTVTPYLDYMRQHWKEGCHNGKQLWREIRAQGYTGSYMSVYRVLKRFRSSVDNQHSTDLSPTVPVLSPRKAQWLLTHEPKQLTAEQLIQLTALCERCPDAATAYPLAQRFARMIRERRVEDLDPWLNDALACGLPFLHNFAIGLNRDYDAVKAALRLKWSNGQVEGQVNRLKVIKRIMYGRAKFDLLRLRVLHPP